MSKPTIVIKPKGITGLKLLLTLLISNFAFVPGLSQLFLRSPSILIFWILIINIFLIIILKILTSGSIGISDDILHVKPSIRLVPGWEVPLPEVQSIARSSHWKRIGIFPGHLFPFNHLVLHTTNQKKKYQILISQYSNESVNLLINAISTHYSHIKISR